MVGVGDKGLVGLWPHLKWILAFNIYELTNLTNFSKYGRYLQIVIVVSMGSILQ